jgi:hypothetical protein
MYQVWSDQAQCSPRTPAPPAEVGARRHPVGQRCQLPAPQSSDATLNARSLGSGMSRSGAKNGAFPAASSSARAKLRDPGAGVRRGYRRHRPVAAPFGDGCSALFCNSCEQLHSTQVRSRRWKPGSGGILAPPARSALTSPSPAPHKHGHLVVATDERRELVRARAAALDRLRYAVERVAAALFERQTGSRPGAGTCAVIRTEPGSASACTRAATYS